MRSFLRFGSPLAVAACLLLAQPLSAEEGLKGNLASVTWLQKHLNDADVLILDASPAQTYAAEHILGATGVDMLTYGLPETPVADMEKRYQAWGISPGKTLVIYDEGGGMAATRLFFSLYQHGFPAEHLFVLDGGLFQWKEKGQAVTEVHTSVNPGSFQIPKLNRDVKAELPEILTASGDPTHNALVEALGPDWHFGEVQAFNRAGHIPNGILLPSTDFYNPDKTFKSAAEIQKMLTYLNIRPEQQIYTYCGGGVAASVPFFALKFILDYPKVALYQQSEMGWLKDERELPYWTYDAPFLMRESKWLQTWSGRRLRMFLGSNISIVDVRPSDMFHQGHLPYALNIPAEVFQSNLSHPEKLVSILGPAGVDASHEAVVISGAGLTKDSALAFLILEELGQKKVSLFMDSMDKWSQLRFPLTTETTVVVSDKAASSQTAASACQCEADKAAAEPPKAAQQLSVPATTYPENPRKDVIIADAQETEGLYPKVFIASGTDMPVNVPEGKIVHVPYSALLKPDGTPKAAKDIWNILAKAGVPRYAELICFSGDPGEAAVNYFILKLMGYPDIKVLVI